MVRSLLALGCALAVFAVTACDDDSPPPAGTFDSSVSTDSGGGVDGAPGDGAAPDARVDGGMDANVPTDSGRADSGVSDSSRPDTRPVEPGSCDRPDPPGTCPTAGCPTGTLCVPGICGGSQCLRGRPCASNADCTTDECNLASGRCQPVSGACTSVRDCARGFECEEAVCVDRRIPCRGPGRDYCPLGYLCLENSDGPAYCQRFFAPCTSDTQCDSDAVCVDVDADGARECFPVGGCDSHAECTLEDEGCGIDPSSAGEAPECSPFSLCHTDADCPTDPAFVCLDAAGDGAGQCAYTGGSCSSNADCSAPAICAMAAYAEVPACLEGSL